ncbi:MAG: ribosome biogenesis GTPase Der [Chloroflexi bacterium]|nr:ribosome biogenesis GTPase Der [Chloroflexota bacterium]MCI0845578.1 ribosome biogenesis GTPase Der [Chloroflexota bacterium]
MPDPIIAIIGRPNVGKSSLFNRILGRRHAIVSEVAGTTRDRLMAEADWEGRRFILVDTGGLESNPEGSIEEKVQEQTEMAVADADVILLLTDVNEGVTASDQMAVERLRRSDKPVVLVVNKVDNDIRELASIEFHRLGMTDTLTVSAYHNFGIHDLMERVVSLLPDADQAEGDGQHATRTKTNELKLAIVGRTNVGKSLLLNTILGQERSIVSEVAGTTRDALDTPFIYRGHSIILIDTAGIRRPGRVQRGIEKYSVIRAVGAVSRSDITILVTDASEIATAHDAHIAGLAWDMCRGLIVVVNKWDLMDEEGRYAREQAANIVRERLHFMPYVPICFTSALRGYGIEELLRTALNLQRERTRMVPQGKLQFVLADALADHAPPTVKGRGRKGRKRLNINRLRQVDVNPPTFLFTVDDPELVHFSYQRYLENRLRKTFNFDHTHLRLLFKKR